MKKSRMLSNVVAEPELPCEIIHENILTRLPVKSLLKFRRVCKSWCELIRTPRFAKMQYDQSNNHHKLMLVSNTAKDDRLLYSIEYGEKCHINVVEIPFSAGFELLEILGSCNGLIWCCAKGESMTTYLWNPSTGEYKLVPNFPNDAYIYGLECGGTSLKKRYPTSRTYGFVYNASAKDYEIIIIYAYYNHKSYFSRYNIYSLRKNSWGGFHDMSPYMIQSFTVGEVVNDALHWVGQRRNESRSVLAFDIGDRKFRELPIPPTTERAFLEFGMATIKGCLSIGIRGKYGVEIWMMKDYGVNESWTKLIKLDHPTIRKYNPFSLLKCFAMYVSTQEMCYHDMLTYTLDRLFSTLGGGNTEAERLIRHCSSTTSYTETLVPLQGYDDNDVI